jgi:hypothetical protein
MESRVRVANADFLRVFAEGLNESERPGALGGMLIAVASLIFCIGLHRAGSK